MTRASASRRFANGRVTPAAPFLSVSGITLCVTTKHEVRHSTVCRPIRTGHAFAQQLYVRRAPVSEAPATTRGREIHSAPQGYLTVTKEVKTMAMGDGSIKEELTKEGKSFRPKKWRVVVSFGRDPVTGKHQRVTRIVTGTKHDAMEVRDRLMAERRQGLSSEGVRTTVGEFANSWLARRMERKDVTRTREAREVHMVSDIVRYIGDIPLRDLNPLDIENFYARMYADRIAEKGKFSKSTMGMYHRLLKQILKQAVNYDLILRNPADKVKAPKGEEVERRSLTLEEFRSLYEYLDLHEQLAYEQRIEIERRQDKRGDVTRHSYLRGLSVVGNMIAVRIAMVTGMRRGEVLGLTWGNVNLEDGFIRVAETVTVYGERKGPKSRAGRRTITIDEATIGHLKTWKDFQRTELARISAIQTDLTPVCCNDRGEDMNPSNFSRWWRGYVTQAGLEGLKFHELRHTQATQLIASGVDLKTVQHRLGHASATLTMNQYAHALAENDRGASNVIGNLLSPASKAVGENVHPR